MTSVPAGALAGRRIVVTRARLQAIELAIRLERLGADVVSCPAIAFLPAADPSPLRDALSSIERYQWIAFTSANAVRAVRAALGPRSIPASVRVAAVGWPTAAALQDAGIHRTSVPSTFESTALARAMRITGGERVLLARSDLARDDLPLALRAEGAVVDDVIAYRTVVDPAVAGLAIALRERRIDAVTFASPSAVRACVGVLGDALAGPVRPAIICIGPATANEARALGLSVDAVAPSHDNDGIVAALLQWFER